MPALLSPMAPAAEAALLHPGYVPGRFYVAGAGPIIANVAVSAADRLMLYPFVVYAPVRVASLFLRVITVGAGSAAKMGIWRNGAGRPTGAPVMADNTGVSTATSGARQTAGVTGFLMPGLWWAGAKFSATLPICLAWHGSAVGLGAIAGAAAAANAIQNGATNQPAVLFTDGQTFANDLPDLTGVGLTDQSGTAMGCPVMGFEVAA